MKFFFLLLIYIKIVNTFKTFIKDIFDEKSNKDDIRASLNNYLKDAFINYNKISDFTFNKCFDELFEINNGLYKFIYSISYSGKNFSDLGNEYSCSQQGFSYYLLSYDYNYKNDLKNYISKIFEFFDKKHFYIGICLPDECDELLKGLFHDYIRNDIYNVKIKKINDSNTDSDEYSPYYSLNEKGYPDENKIAVEKRKYYAFLVIFIFCMIIFGLETLISGLFFLMPNILNKGQFLDFKLIEGNYNENEDEDITERTDSEFVEKVIFNNPSFSKERETYYEIAMKILYKYFSLSNNILILTLRKSLFYNNRNLEIIYKIKIFCLILITFSTNFDVFIQLPSRNFFDELFYKEIYFFFIKISSFGLDMYICLEGFEVLFKFMSYYKKYFFDVGKKTMSFIGFIKFYLFSLYKIISYIIIFFVLIFFSRYYIYMHYGGKLYSYYADNINNENILKIFNPKYSIFSYFFDKDENNDEFLMKSKMSLLFINEFYFFTITIIIFYLGIRFKSKIFDSIILIILLISFCLSYLCDFIDGDRYDKYNYNKITQNISLVKYPHILFNHYLIGAFSGIICFYLRDFSKNNNVMMNEQEYSPFNILLWAIEFFDYLNQKGRKIAILISIIIQLLLCLFYFILINLDNKGKEKKDYIISINLTSSIKVLFYYESGVFIFCFCVITILLFIKNLDKKIRDKYSILYLLYQINFTFVNTVYLLMFTYYCYYETHFKLSYQNLWLSTFGFFFIFCLENLIITIILVLPFKMLFKNLLEKFFVLENSNAMQEFRYKSYNTLNNETSLNQFNPNFQEDDLES